MLSERDQTQNITYCTKAIYVSTLAGGLIGILERATTSSAVTWWQWYLKNRQGNQRAWKTSLEP